MSSLLPGHAPRSTPRKHIVPTHLNLPDQVLALWSLSLSARQLLLVLVGAGLGGSVFQHLAPLSRAGLAGEALRLVAALVPVLLLIVLAWYRHAGRYLEVWLIVLLRYRLRPTRYLWRSIRMLETLRFPRAPAEDDPGRDQEARLSVPVRAERRP
jgi:hypothetical protein